MPHCQRYEQCNKQQARNGRCIFSKQGSLYQVFDHDILSGADSGLIRNTLMKLTLIIILIAILVSLGSGLWFLTKDDQGSARVLTALKIRVLLSAILIGFLIFGYFQGWIFPQSALVD